MPPCLKNRLIGRYMNRSKEKISNFNEFIGLLSYIYTIKIRSAGRIIHIVMVFDEFKKESVLNRVSFTRALYYLPSIRARQELLRR